MRILTWMFYFFCFFPYIKVFPKVDTQPNALIVGFILSICFLFKEKKIPRELFYFFIISGVAIFFVDFSDTFTSLRGILNYWSLCFCSYATYKTYDKQYFVKFLKYSINIWLLVGMIEKFGDRYFFKFLISDVRTSIDRGVTGLAPEPTFYGIICVFFMVLVLETFDESKNIYLFNLLFQIFFLSQSSMTILFLGIWIVIYFFKNINFKNFILLIIVCIAIHFIIIYLMEGTRIYSLYTKFTGIKQIFYKDASLNERAGHIYYSLKGALESNLCPNGFVNWKRYTLIESQNKDYFYRFSASSSGRIMSGFGGVIFEMGFLGIVMIINYIYVLFKGLKNKEISIYILIIMFSAIQISNPLLGIILGVGLVNLKTNKIVENVSN